MMIYIIHTFFCVVFYSITICTGCSPCCKKKKKKNPMENCLFRFIFFNILLFLLFIPYCNVLDPPHVKTRPGMRKILKSLKNEAALLLKLIFLLRSWENVKIFHSKGHFCKQGRIQGGGRHASPEGGTRLPNTRGSINP